MRKDPHGDRIPTYCRAIDVSFEWPSAPKKRRVLQILAPFRGAVNFFIRKLWNNGAPKGALDKETLALLKSTRLTERMKSNALRVALEKVSSTVKSASELGVEPGLLSRTCPQVDTT